jgi:hypothetical protein
VFGGRDVADHLDGRPDREFRLGIDCHERDAGPAGPRGTRAAGVRVVAVRAAVTVRTAGDPAVGPGGSGAQTAGEQSGGRQSAGAEEGPSREDGWRHTSESSCASITPPEAQTTACVTTAGRGSRVDRGPGVA